MNKHEKEKEKIINCLETKSNRRNGEKFFQKIQTIENSIELHNK